MVMRLFFGLKILPVLAFSMTVTSCQDRPVARKVSAQNETGVKPPISGARDDSRSTDAGTQEARLIKTCQASTAGAKEKIKACYVAGGLGLECIIRHADSDF